MHNNITYSKAIEKVMLDNGCFAPLKLLYKEVWNYKDKSKITGITPDNTIMFDIDGTNLVEHDICDECGYGTPALV